MVKSCVIIIKENNTISIYEAPFLNVIKVIPIIHQKKFKMSEKIASFNHKKKYLKKKSDLRNNNNNKNNNKEIFSRRFYLDKLIRWSDHLVNYFSLMHRCWINTDSLLLTFKMSEKIASFNHKKKYLKKKSDLRNNNNNKNNNKEIFSRRFYLDKLIRWSDHLVNYFSLMHRCWINTDSLLLTFSCREIYVFLLILFEICVFGAAHG